MNLSDWIQYFERNRYSFCEPPLPPNASMIPRALRVPLAQSLAVFQLGESGGGTRLMRYVRETLRHRPAELAGYDLAIGLFVAEEQYHSLLLEKLVTHLGGNLVQKHWTNSVFRRVRNLLGMEFNIQILLTAELIAEVYYGMIYRRTSDLTVRFCCHKILKDEMRHIAFHTSFLQTRLAQLPRPLKRLWKLGFATCHQITVRVVAWDHRRLLNALGMSQSEFIRLALRAGQRFLRRIDTNQISWQPEGFLRAC